MYSKNIILSLIFLFSSYVIVSQMEENTLQQIHVIFRHGEKTPEKIALYPKDPYKNESFWYPYDFGSLTNKGKMQAYNMGKELRNKYNNFLGKIYFPNIMYAQSTNYDRTKMSLQLVLAGLWPPTLLQKWNPFLAWQPIPFEYKPMEKDKLLKFALAYCKKYQYEYYKARKSIEILNFFKENSQLIEFVDENTGLNCSSTLDFLMLHFVLLAEEQNGYKLPKWTEKVYPEFLEEASALEYKTQTYNNEMLKSGAGFLIKQIIEDARNKIENKITQKLFLYSGHDFNIVSILAALKNFQGKIPPCASYIVFELHKINNNFGFRIFYQDYSQNSSRLLTFPGCEQFCLFADFVNLTFNIIPNNDYC